MKKVKLDKLSLNRMAIARLNHDDLQHLRGGGTAHQRTCGTASSGDGDSCKCPGRTVRDGCIPVVGDDGDN